MITQQLTFFQQDSRIIPVMIYLPDGFELLSKIKTVIFGNGFQSQQKFIEKKDYYCKQYTYLADFFTKKNYAFISIQYEVLGDQDCLPDQSKGKKIDQIKERTPLWIKDEKIILEVIEQFKKSELKLDFSKFIIAGHSNGADVAKFFANRHSSMISHVISMDGRRCPISPFVELKLLSLEANDTCSDEDIIPGKLGYDPWPGEREKIEYFIFKPKEALHRSYCEYEDDSKNDFIARNKALKAIDWFINL